MNWLIFFSLCIGLLLWGFRTSEKKSAAMQTKAPEPPQNQPIKPRMAAITTQRDAKATFEATLRRYGYAKSSKEHFRETVAEFVEEMKEHAEELRSIIDTAKEELDKQREYRDGIAGELQGMLEQRAEDGSDAEAIAKKERHLGHLDREIAELAATLQEGREALKAFRADRTPFIAAYAEHTIAGSPNPNRARQ